MLCASDIELLKLKKLEEAFEELEKDYIRLEFNRDYRELAYYPTRSCDEIATSRRDEYIKKFISFGIDTPEYRYQPLDDGVIANCFSQINTFRTKLHYRVNESKRVYKELLEKEKREESQRILLQKQHDEQKAKMKEQKELQRKQQIHNTALARIAAKKAEIEKAKFEEEVLAEMARIEASM
jgi:hypothetical protein